MKFECILNNLFDIAKANGVFVMKIEEDFSYYKDKTLKL